jgi:phosphatidylglycerophosphate synthase
VAVAFGLSVIVVLRWYAIRDKANAPPAPHDGRRSSRLAYLAANALTFIRPGIGIAAGMAIAHHRITLGFVLFLLGLTSDVLDGLIARMFQAQSAHGREWDAVADANLSLT